MEFQGPIDEIRRWCCILLIALCPLLSGAQGNLVVNGSFEDIESCNLSQGALPEATGWFNFYSESSNVDLYNECSSNPTFLVPNNEPLGNQAAKDGTGYAGFLPLSIYEAPLGTLQQRLVKDTLYYVCFSVSLCDNCGKAVRNIGLMFVDTILQVPLSSFDTLVADVIDTSYVIDKDGWLSIEGLYTSDGSEQNLVIGLFPPFETSDLLAVNGVASWKYYYLDDVIVRKATQSEINGMRHSSFDYSVYPNPALDFAVIESRTRLFGAYLMDMAGRKIKALNMRTAVTWEVDMSELPTGIYLIEAIAEDGRRAVRKVVKGP